MNALIEILPPRVSESFRCFDRRENQLPARWHQHPEIELTYVPKGPGERLIGDHVGRFSDHDLVLVGPNLPHNWAADQFRHKRYDMHEAIVIFFDYDFLGDGFFEVPEAANLKNLLNRAHRGIWFPPEFAEQIGQRMKKVMTLTGIRRLTELLQCLELLCECKDSIQLASEGFERDLSSFAHPKMELVMKHIAQHFCDAKLTVSQLADLSNMNKSAFSRQFKQTTGRTPTQFLNDLRLGFSRRLLLDENVKILDVCYQSGFSSVSHFNKLFKTQYQVSPSEFREAHFKVHDSSVPQE